MVDSGPGGWGRHCLTLVPSQAASWTGRPPSLAPGWGSSPPQCSFLPPLSHTCMRTPLGGCPHPSAPSSPPAWRSRNRQPPTTDQSGPFRGPHHTSVCKVGVPGLALVGSPGSLIWKLEWSREGLRKSLPVPPPLHSQTLAGLDRSCQDHPFPVLGIGESWEIRCPSPFPCPLWARDQGSSAIPRLPPTSTETGDCTLLGGRPHPLLTAPPHDLQSTPRPSS